MPVSPQQARSISLVIYLPNLRGGGAERLHANLASQFIEAGYRVIFLLDRLEGELLSELPGDCIVHALNATRQIYALPKLVTYMRQTAPDILITNMEHMNVMAVIARYLARARTKILASQHSVFSDQVKQRSWKFRILPALYRLILPFSEGIVVVSEGVGRDLANASGLQKEHMTVIYNGVVTRDFDLLLQQKPMHSWFTEHGPIILSIGRLVKQKDFSTLIEAFKRIAPKSNARLVILGEGPLRPELEAQIRSLGSFGTRVSLPGFISNPLPLLRRAQLFVLSSRNEGFGNVIAEALACGTPVVSTDCPYGPGEILSQGHYGDLVPVGDAGALSDAMFRALNREHNHKELIRRGRSFNVSSCAENYIRLFEECISSKSKQTTSASCKRFQTRI